MLKRSPLRAKPFIAARKNAVTPIVHNTTECSHSSDQPAPRRITPRAASISHVVGITFETWAKNHGIESVGNT